jgi:hypothetical protein
MPIAVVLVLTLAIMAMRRGVDFPLVVVACALGDKSNGTILEEPIDMAGNFVDTVWNICVQVFNRGGEPANGAMAHVLHVAQMAGVAG